MFTFHRRSTINQSQLQTNKQNINLLFCNNCIGDEAQALPNANNKGLIKFSRLRGHYYVITKCPKSGPSSPPPLFALIQFWQSLPPSNVQNLTSTPPPPSPPSCLLLSTIFTTTKNSKFCDFIVLQPVVISPCKYHKKCSLNVPQVNLNTDGVIYSAWFANFATSINQI